MIIEKKYLILLIILYNNFEIKNNLLFKVNIEGDERSVVHEG